MNAELRDIRAMLVEGIELSGQGSYARRMPSAESLPLIIGAREALLTLINRDRDNADAWQLLSQAHECLLQYRDAIAALEVAAKLRGAPTKKDRKRLAHLQGALKEWDELQLSPEELAELGAFLQSAGVGDEASGRSLDFTTVWLRNHGYNVQDALDSLARRGGFTDFQILFNVVRG